MLADPVMIAVVLYVVALAGANALCSSYCQHPRLSFEWNIYGDLILYCGKRSVWRCDDCDAYVWKDELHPDWHPRVHPGWPVFEYGLCQSGAQEGPRQDEARLCDGCLDVAAMGDAHPRYACSGACKPRELPCTACPLTATRWQLCGNGVEYYEEREYTCTGARPSCREVGKTYTSIGGVSGDLPVGPGSVITLHFPDGHVEQHPMLAPSERPAATAEAVAANDFVNNILITFLREQPARQTAAHPRRGFFKRTDARPTNG